MHVIPPLALSLVTALLLTSSQDKPQDKQVTKKIAMRVLSMDEVVAQHKKSKRSYTQFFKVPSLHTGIYTLPKGGRDGQSPHAQDEIYYVLKGKAKMDADGRKEPVEKGSFIFVAAGATHRFVDIEEDLELLVLFSTGPLQKKGR